MRDRINTYLSLENSGSIAAITVVGVTFFVTYMGLLQFDDPPPLTARWVALLLGGIYLWLLLQEGPVMARIGPHPYFAIQFSLVAIIQFILFESPTIWLIAMPLVGFIVEIYSGWLRWLFLLAVLSLLTLSVGLQTGNWLSAYLFTLYFSPALIFVVIFVRITQAANEQRAKAEQLTVDLAAANRQLGAYAAQAEELATTKERNRIAREIHDNLGHYLTVVNVQLKAAQAIMAQDPAKAQDALQKAQRLTEEGLTAVRQSVSALRESPIDQKPLPEAIAALVRDHQSTGIVTELDVQGEPRPLDPKASLTIYRAVQEGLTNIRKHARASRIDLRLDYRDPEQVQLWVVDNGVGTAVSTTNSGFGLLGLRERIQLLGGRIETKTAPGEGFELAIALPG
ncbi:MAG: sensor histidine kinase [Chloroflexota bacterium]